KRQRCGESGRQRHKLFLPGQSDVRHEEVNAPAENCQEVFLMSHGNKMHTVHGLHHITAIAGPAQENLDFYAGILGMRLVKRSINQDDPGTYHLFYADAEGRPGSDLTFFPWAEMAPPRRGHGLATEVDLEVPDGS